MENRIKCWLAVLLTCWAIALPARSDGKAPKIKNGTLVFAEPRREKGQTDVLQLRCDPIPTVRVAFVGLGMRGSHGRRALHASGGRSGRRAVRHTSLDRRAGATDTGRSTDCPRRPLTPASRTGKRVCELRRRRSDIQLYRRGNCTRRSPSMRWNAASMSRSRFRQP